MPEPLPASFDRKDRALIRLLQEDLPLVERPYHELAAKVGLTPEEVIQRVRRWSESGVIRRFGASVRHVNMGYKANCMVVWRVETEAAQAAGKVFAAFPEVTHCYRRPEFPGWPYSLYTMIHGADQEAIEALVARMSAATGLIDYRLVHSVKEWKKTSMKYFADIEKEARE
ncbi:AsnC family transcriptional regulator [bacterium]|nr:AsnC family transcriptional regulator [bacterium]